jgi:hypothetical protein
MSRRLSIRDDHIRATLYLDQYLQNIKNMQDLRWRIFNSAEGAADINVEGKKYVVRYIRPLGEAEKASIHWWQL